jgi:chemosensory pili system protein ChpA (sensor histidine kinase/response regulator)
LKAEANDLIKQQINHLIQDQTLDDCSYFAAKVNDSIAAEQQKTAEQTKPVTPSETSLFVIPDTEPDLLEAFTEECEELLESSGNAIKSWQSELSNEQASKQLQRDLHTLKGGSRLTNISPIADLTHHTESLVLMAIDGKHPIDQAFFDLLQRCQDRLADMQDQLARRSTISRASELIDEIAHFTGQTQQLQTQAINEHSSAAADNQQAIKQPPKKPRPDGPNEALLTETNAIPSTANDQVRVRSDLLDFLTNFAGEVNISPDRVGQQNTAIKQQLAEMEATVERLQDQLRQLEMETEAQILFRYEDEVVRQQSEFDPLELDRFSRIQRLSRGLNESVNDLHNFSDSLNHIVRESDTILLQQSRLSTDLQQGLMNTRLLPFSGLVPRFERIVRQTNSELGKQSELTVYGADRELDRTILDRIVAPIEHILRNAIAHGVETPEQRREQGKDELAQLTLTITRDGSELLLTLSDDGQGIDVEKIKHKALERHLINPDNLPSDEELIQLILSSGFSTADNVSQLAGRGVGMDVVSSEITALKGRLSIQSISGQGTTFSIRLPLTLSIMQALLVGSGEQLYALPLASVHAGERITCNQAKTLLAQGADACYEYNGAYYQFHTLETLLGRPLNLPEEDGQPLPILLFNSGETHVAVLVDSVLNSREIVLKSVGEQLGHISSINGATILGDGQVAFILNIPTLISEAAKGEGSGTHQTSLAASIIAEREHTPVAMVVDDSITMRKASGNLLKRHGFDVITARDGIDAVALLNEQVPDVILLDIEMPRMDGFEFATLVRNDKQFSHLPIVMITSRSGDKHRSRADAIGVNAYLGKPYQEIELVAILQELLGESYPNTKH